MTWEELCEKAKEMGAGIVVSQVGEYTYEKIMYGKLCFYRDGEITCPYMFINEDGYPEHDMVIVAKDRTPDQMYMIMEALR